MINPLDLKYIFEEIEENSKYESYLTEHIRNVKKGYDWLKEYLPEVVSSDNCVGECCYYGELEDIIKTHDASKYIKIPDSENYYELTCEYDPYADYFYGEKTPEVEVRFDLAWLSHIHRNPHHWQHWVLNTDEEGQKLLDIPYVFIVEMICDHWSFSWKANNLYEIFEWYDKHKGHILMSDKTRSIYESILYKIKEKLDEMNPN